MTCIVRQRQRSLSKVQIDGTLVLNCSMLKLILLFYWQHKITSFTPEESFVWIYSLIKASINKGPHVGQPVFSVLFALLSLAGDSPPASKRTKIPRKSKAVRCEAVLPEQKCSQTRKRPQRILCVFSRALTQYEGISARQNRMFSCLSMANSARKRASVSECAAASRSLFKREPNAVGLV